MPVSIPLGRLRQEGCCQFEASLGYIAKSGLKTMMSKIGCAVEESGFASNQDRIPTSLCGKCDSEHFCAKTNYEFYASLGQCSWKRIISSKFRLLILHICLVKAAIFM